MKRIMIGIIVALGLLVAGATPVDGVSRSALVLDRNGQIRHVGPEITLDPLVSDQPVVSDFTPSGSNWKIAEAVTEWNKRSAFEALLRHFEGADVQVYERYDSCGQTTIIGVVLGCTYSDGTINLNPDYAHADLAEHVGLHELGHAFGHPHVTGVRSVMQPTVNETNWLRAPTSYDYRVQQDLYGR